MSQLLHYLGTDSLDYNECRSQLQKIGASMYANTSPDFFTIKISGFDQYFDQTMQLVSYFFKRAKTDKKKMNLIISEEKINNPGIGYLLSASNRNTNKSRVPNSFFGHPLIR